MKGKIKVDQKLVHWCRQYRTEHERMWKAEVEKKAMMIAIQILCEMTQNIKIYLIVKPFDDLFIFIS